jgi:hypothetical protein
MRLGPAALDVAAEKGLAANQPLRAGFLGKRFRAQGAIMQRQGPGVLDTKGRARTTAADTSAQVRGHRRIPRDRTATRCGVVATSLNKTLLKYL